MNDPSDTDPPEPERIILRESDYLKSLERARSLTPDEFEAERLRGIADADRRIAELTAQVAAKGSPAADDAAQFSAMMRDRVASQRLPDQEFWDEAAKAADEIASFMSFGEEE